MSANFTLIIMLVIILVGVSIIVIGGLYLLNKGIKEQYRYNHTALPSLDKEKEDMEAEEEQYQFESILGESPSRKSDWSDFHDVPVEEPEFEYQEEVLPDLDSVPQEANEDTNKRKQINSLPDLS